MDMEALRNDEEVVMAALAQDPDACTPAGYHDPQSLRRKKAFWCQLHDPRLLLLRPWTARLPGLRFTHMKLSQ